MPVIIVIRVGVVVIKRLSLLVIVVTSFLLGQESLITVKYISQSHVYINAGKEAGLGMKDTLIVKNKNVILGKLIIDYVSDFSASCRFSGDFSKLRIGLPVMRINTGQREIPITIQKPQKKVAVNPPEKRRATGRKKAVSGSIRLMAYYWNDFDATALDFFQPGIQFDFKARSLFNGKWDFKAKMNSRGYYRSRIINEIVPRQEWRNRIYQFYVNHDNLNNSYILKAGRIMENELTGIGYLDGVIFGLRPFEHSAFGVIAGTRPDWRNSNLNLNIQKYGAFYSYRNKNHAGHRWRSTIALNGEYNGSVVSREYVSFYNIYSRSSKLYTYLQGEIEINRDWRREKTGSTFGISNFYASVQYNWKKWLRGGISLDQRQNYWTFEYRSLADSLFNDLARQGLRVNLTSQLSGNYSLSLNAGVSHRDNDSQSTWSAGLAMSNYNWLNAHLRLNANSYYFHNLFMDAINVNFSLGKGLFRNFQVTPGIRYYLYTNNDISSSNLHFTLNSDFYFLQQFSISNWLEYVTGDDENGIRTWFELGYFF